MKPYSNLDRGSTATRSALAIENSVEPKAERPATTPSRNGPAKVEASAAFSSEKATANGVSIPKSSSLRFPGEDSGQSLAKMAESDLDAALQLLADRAQYITGAGGAAIALRRDGRNDLICRANAGSNAPELGALLSAEFGLSGESVRTRQPLRCDDAERDPRVNREGCRQMGIASVLVVPIVQNDQVLGVFELFSGKANAFADRDLAALKRLSEMVETAVKLAYSPSSLTNAATEKLGVNNRKPPQPSQPSVRVPQMQALAAVEGQSLKPSIAALLASASAAPERAKPSAPKKPLFWSAALNPTMEKPQTAESDRSHVPAVLRNLRKCQACGFPISEGRVLCVECEEKKWRGKLRTPSPKVSPESSNAVGALAVIAPTVDLSNIPATPSSSLPLEVKTVEASQEPNKTPGHTLILSAGLAPSESWLSSNKFVVGAVLIVVAIVAAIVFLR